MNIESTAKRVYPKPVGHPLQPRQYTKTFGEFLTSLLLKLMKVGILRVIIMSSGRP